MIIRKAEENEYDAVRAFYHSLIEEMKDSPYDIGWEKDIYPAPDFLRESLRTGELYIGMEQDAIAAAMVINHQSNNGYRKFQWAMEADDSEIAVIHALGVHPAYGGRGYAGQMVQEAIAIAGEAGMKVLRLDVLKGNVPAEKLYTGAGFQYQGTLQMYYEDTGWTDYELYEYVLERPFNSGRTGGDYGS